jgi:ethanolamine utilization protein EutQ
MDSPALFTASNVDTWYRRGDRRIFLGDVLDPSNSESMTVGFARYAPGESNEWVVTYDEALVVTKGSFTVAAEDGRETTARAGEVIFLRNGTSVVYSAKEEGAELVYVTNPHWAQVESAQAAFLESFRPSEESPQPTDGVALLRSIFDPLERGESDDFQPFYDALGDDVVHTLSVGELRGKQAVVDYFASGGETIEFRPFEKPLEYYGGGNRVVMVGEETFKVKETGVTHLAEWAWVVDLRDGLITRIVEIQDLSPGVAEPVRAIVSKAQAGEARAAFEQYDAVALLRSIYDPLERGESDDFQSFHDALSEAVVLTTPVGEVRGKQAVVGYFTNLAARLEYDIFVRPLEYYGDGKRVVQLGGERFRDKETGATHEADWAWVFDVEDGRITRILAIQHLSGIADEVAQALAKAQKEAQAAPAA